MTYEEFQAVAPKFATILSSGIEKACSGLDFDVRCLDWFNYTPDFFIEKKEIKAA